MVSTSSSVPSLRSGPKVTNRPSSVDALVVHAGQHLDVLHLERRAVHPARWSCPGPAPCLPALRCSSVTWRDGGVGCGRSQAAGACAPDRPRPIRASIRPGAASATARRGRPRAPGTRRRRSRCRPRRRWPRAGPPACRAAARRCSSSTLALSWPGMRGSRGVTPVARITSSNPPATASRRRRACSASARSAGSSSMRRREVAQRLAELLLARHALGHVELAADVARRRRTACTWWPRSASVVARGQARPGPAPTTATRFGAAGERDLQLGLVARARIDQAGRLLVLKVWSRQAWLQAMQVLISSARPCAALSTNSGSARNGRAIDTMSAWPTVDAGGEQALGDFGRVDAVGGDQRDRHACGAQFARILPVTQRERRARHRWWRWSGCAPRASRCRC